jgi:hypothetical protein
MRCAEFEARLNDLLDERVEPAADAVLTDHAERCPLCAELAASHELLLEGTRLLPKVQLRPGESEMLGRRVVAAVAVEGPPFRHATVELADRQPLAMASGRRASLAMIGVAAAAAAAVLIAVSPWFRNAEAPQPNQGPDLNNVAKEIKSELPADPTLDLPPANLLIDPGQEPIAWVGYQMADGLKPVTSSMVEKMREWRKRPPIFYNDESPRSSQYLLDEATSGLS